MGNSLKDQLIALGLADQPKRSKPGRAGRKQAGPELSLDRAYRLRRKEEKETAAAKRHEKRAEDLLRRQVNGQIQKLVDAHALNDRTAEVKRNFLYKGRIRSVLVTPAQLRALNAGELGLVFLRGNYILMLPEHVEEVRRISADHVPELGGGSSEDEEFPVPDDLVW
jgi:uncharacterized protein YaiL (DUF2058 family)